MKTRTKRVSYTVNSGSLIDPRQVVVVHIVEVANDQPTRIGTMGVPQKGEKTPDVRRKMCPTSRRDNRRNALQCESQIRTELHLNDAKVVMDRLSDALAVYQEITGDSPLIKSFDEGKILLVKKEFLTFIPSLPGVSFVIVKTEKGYFLKGYNGNTVAEEIWGLRGHELRDKTGHNGFYIHPNGVAGMMERLSGALAVCRGCDICTPEKGSRYCKDYHPDDSVPYEGELEHVLKIADERPLLA